MNEELHCDLGLDSTSIPPGVKKNYRKKDTFDVSFLKLKSEKRLEKFLVSSLMHLALLSTRIGICKKPSLSSCSLIIAIDIHHTTPACHKDKLS